MTITVSGRKMPVTDALRQYAEEKVGNAIKAVDADTVSTEIVLYTEKNPANPLPAICEVTVRVKGHIVRVEESEEDMYAAIDLVVDKVEAQIKKHVSRVKEQRRQARNASVDVFTYNLEADPDEEPAVVGTERFAPKPLHLDEALMQLESIGSEFLVFINAETDRVNVVYRRRIGGYAVIDPVL